MIYGLYLSTAGARAQSTRQDVIANNVANVDTTGFRRQYLAARARLDHLAEFGAAPSIRPNDPRQIGGGVQVFKTYSDLATPGVVKPSSSPLHMAIEGKGFFRVRNGSETFLTRDGSFSLDEKGTLLASGGTAQVLTAEGTTITIDPNLPFDVTPDNQVVQEGKSLGTLDVVLPRHPDTLEHRGRNLLAGDGQTIAADARVKQYLLEGSNVEPVREMTDLIQAARAFEINVNMVQLQNDTLAQLIQSVPRRV